MNKAWTDTGNSGSISQTLVNRIRSEHGLSGNLRGAMTPAMKTTVKSKATSKKTRFKKAASNGMPKPQTTATKVTVRALPSDRMLAELEGDLDRMIFKLMGVGGMEKVEEALRTVRRVVVRSHKG